LACGGTGAVAALFLHIGSEVAEGETRSFDDYILYGAKAARNAHPWITEMMRDLSGVGGTVTLLLVTVAACGYLALVVSRRRATIVALSIAGSEAAVEVFKWAFERARPDVPQAEFAVRGLSFPSGHSSMSAVVFLTLGALIAYEHDRPLERWYIMGVAVAATVLIGLSRAALGVHWATDVLGGWAFGAAWASATLLLVTRYGGQKVLTPR
jgi:undecaprenyl-diphosphatase